MKENFKALAHYRIEQADESLDSAQLLSDNGKYRSSVSRSYYAMFYAVLSLLAFTQNKTSKHSGVISLFNREFVKSGMFDKDFSKWLTEAFDLRQRADYQEMFTVSEDRAKTVLENARIFINGVKEKIQNMMLPESGCR